MFKSNFSIRIFLTFQLGVTKCLLDLMEIFDPINFNEIWSEFNILEVSLSLLNSNYITGTDLICQNDTMTLCINLLAGKIYLPRKFSIKICVIYYFSIYSERIEPWP